MDKEISEERDNRIGTVEVITGCMFSGKTKEMFERIERAQLQGYEAIIFKPEIDSKSTRQISSQSGKTKEAVLISEKGEGPREILAHVSKEKVIGIDRAHLFSDELVYVVEELARKDKRVIISGLDQTYRGEPFEPVPQLLAKADYIDKLHAVCSKCGNKPATKSQRIRNDEEPAHVDEETILVGSEIYEPRCRNHHVVKD